MELINIHGKSVKFNVTKYNIDWDRIVSAPQQQVKDAIREYWSGHLVCEEFLIPGSRLRIDIVNFNLKLAIEVSPSSSHDYNEFFHKNRSSFLKFKKREMVKSIWCETNNIQLVEIFDEELGNDKLIKDKILFI